MWETISAYYFINKDNRLTTIEHENTYKQGNSVARDLPRTGSEANTTIFVYIGFRFPLSLSTIWRNHLSGR